MDNNFTADQQSAALLIEKWYKERKKDSNFFYLSGYAGTGKNYLISKLPAILGLHETQIAFVAYTGKAASVLSLRGLPASTIHRLVYTPMETEVKSNLNGQLIITKKIEFVRNEKIPNYKLIIVDEISMVNKQIMYDLLSFGIPVLGVGDQAQLPPIEGTNEFLSEPNAVLSEIVRQAEDNPIIKIATMARNNEHIPYGDYGSVLVLNKNMLNPIQMKDLLLKADQVICGTNATRKYWNDEIRRYKGIDTIAEPLPIQGDKVIFTVNNWSLYLDEEEKYNLVNGTIGNIENNEILDGGINLGRLSFKPDFLDEITEDVIYDTGIFTKGEWSYDMHQKAYFMANKTFKLKKWLSKKNDKETLESFRDRVMEYIRDEKNSIEDRQINRLEYGYVISTHKAQGSEWDKVVVLDESSVFGPDMGKHLYTAITRAKKRLVIIR
jgi:exodeoxyribonuclease-5